MSILTAGDSWLGGMMTTDERATVRDWLQLVRLPNVFTVLADTSAAFLLVAHGVDPVGRFLLVLVSVVFLYWAGMILNDVWDLEVDKAERSSRPLASGRIAVSAATRAGWGLLGAGTLLALVIGFVQAGGASSLVPGAVAICLAIAIVMYDGPLKRTPFAIIAMGLCRFLSFLLGASAGMQATEASLFFAPHVIAMAAGFGIYIVGVTLMARGEAVGGSSSPVLMGLIVTLLGLGVLAFAPRFAPAGTPFLLNAERGFPVLIAMLAVTIVHRASRAIATPEPSVIQATIKLAILTLIPLSASVALLAAGWLPACAIFSLVVPALFLGSFLRVT